MKLGAKLVTLENDSCYLTTLIKDNVSEIHVNGLNDPRVNYYLNVASSTMQTKKSVEKYVEDNFFSEADMLFAIHRGKNEPYCGTIRVHDINLSHNIACIGICLFDKASWGKGLASNALRLVSNWLVSDLDIKWIEAGIYENNLSSIKLFEKNGYQLKYAIDGKYKLHDEHAKVLFYARNN